MWKPLGAERTVWTVFIFATSGLTIAAAKMCITDAVLLLWVTIAQLCLYAIYRGNRSWPVVITMALAIGVAGLTKGPVILGIQAMTLISLGLFWLLQNFFGKQQMPVIPETDVRVASSVLDYAVATQPPSTRWQRLIDQFTAPTGESITKFVVGITIVTAVVLPWVLMVNARSHGFIGAGVKHDVWDRMMTPLEQHVGPPGYYFLTIWITYFPWSLLLPMAIGVAIHRRADPRVRFALAAVLGPWIMLECVRTKLPHYFLPAFPPLAFLTADALVRVLHREINDLRGRVFVAVVAIWAVLIAAAASGTWLIARPDTQFLRTAMIIVSISGVIFAGAVLALFSKRRIAAAAVAMGLGTFAMVAIMYCLYLPYADFLRVSPRVAKILIDHGVTQPHQVIMLDYMEPSLAFAQGGTIREAGPVGFSRKFEPDFTPWMVVTKTIWEKASPELRSHFDIVGEVYGLAYADRGKWVHVMVIHHK